MGTQKNVTLQVLAKKLGVSTATISRALNPHTQQKVKRETLERIQKMAKRYRYFPNISARNLVRKESHVVGVVIPYSPTIFCSEYYMQLLSGVADGMKETRYSFTLYLASSGGVANLLEFLRLKEIAGVIVSHWTSYCRSIRELESLGVPVLGINEPIHSKFVSFISCDHFQGARDAVRYLVERGHRKIGMLLGPKESLDNQERFGGYRAALQGSGIVFNPEWVISAGRFDQEAGYQAMRHLLSKKVEVTAFFCANDEIAIGALKAITEQDKRCPQDISLVGFDGLKLGECVHPSITSIDQQVYQLGKEGVKVLLEILEGKRKSPFIEKVPCHLVERESVAQLTELAPV